MTEEKEPSTAPAAGGPAHWQEVYGRKAPDEVSWYQPVPERSLEWIREHAPAPDASILDVGGGASTLVDHLLDDGYREVAVLDLAPAALERSRQRLGERAERVSWFAADLLEFTAPHPFDLWHDRAVLHFLVDEPRRQRYAEVLRRTLRPGGHALIATFAPDGPERCSGLEVLRSDCADIDRLLGDEFTLVRDEREFHRTPSGGEQRFQYCLFRRHPDASTPR